MKATASAKNITLPDSISQEHQDAITKLSQKSGKAFDKAFMEMMVDDHKKAIDLFEKESSNGNDSTLKIVGDQHITNLCVSTWIQQRQSGT